MDTPPSAWLSAPALLVCAVCIYGATYGALMLARTPPPDALGCVWDSRGGTAPLGVAPLAPRDGSPPHLADVPPVTWR